MRRGTMEETLKTALPSLHDFLCGASPKRKEAVVEAMIIAYDLGQQDMAEEYAKDEAKDAAHAKGNRHGR